MQQLRRHGDDRRQRIHSTDMQSTVIGCEAWYIMRQETLILDVGYQNAESFEIDSDRLTIFSTERRSLIYRAG